MNNPDEIAVSIDDAYVATVEIRRPPNNYFDTELITALADVIARLDEDEACRAIVLCSEGRHFCAGANLGGAGEAQLLEPGQGNDLYRQAVRIFSGRLPIVAAVQGAAIGGGLGLACAADFRVASPTSRFVAKFPCSASITGSASRSPSLGSSGPSTPNRCSTRGAGCRAKKRWPSVSVTA